MNGLRLLPWSGPEGKPCYLSTDDDNSRLSRKADQVETLQLGMGAQLLQHSQALLTNDKVGVVELRFLACRLTEALRDALRVAESRGGRLLSYVEDGTDELDGDHPDRRPG
ncbi:hypothetical protein ABZ370_01930 [Streptomyces sp. NPDC005962]|uniref:hypothetical protein n=1 Tax=Streptomyces sp. NPDC005962 TaxID=3154466 RepID=UPI0033E650FF